MKNQFLPSFDNTKSFLIILLIKGKIYRIFLNLAQTLHTVDHGIFIMELERLNITGTALSLLKSYLSDQQQITKIGNV